MVHLGKLSIIANFVLKKCPKKSVFLPTFFWTRPFVSINLWEDLSHSQPSELFHDKYLGEGSSSGAVSPPAVPEKANTANTAGRKSVPAKPGKVKKVPWTVKEKKFILENFHNFITGDRLPGILECQQLISRSAGLLARRTWRNVKDWVRNYKKKKPT